MRRRILVPSRKMEAKLGTILALYAKLLSAIALLNIEDGGNVLVQVFLCETSKLTVNKLNRHLTSRYRSFKLKASGVRHSSGSDIPRTNGRHGEGRGRVEHYLRPLSVTGH